MANSPRFPQFGTLVHSAYSRSRVVATAQAIRSACDQTGRIPFDALDCAERFGVRVRFAPLPQGIAGRIARDGEGYRIDLQRSDSRARQRFTLAHELGHLAFAAARPSLPREIGIAYEVANIHRREEALCDRLAAELLMPATIFRRRAKVIQPSFNSIISLAQEFDVSITAAMGRTQALGGWSMGTRSWRRGSRGKIGVVVGKRETANRQQLASELTSILMQADTIVMTELLRSFELLSRYERGAYVSIAYRHFEVVIRRVGRDSFTAIVLTLKGAS
jgi:Zn-dependent peptidase ImmA (M78 family)